MLRWKDAGAAGGGAAGAGASGGGSSGAGDSFGGASGAGASGGGASFGGASGAGASAGGASAGGASEDGAAGREAEVPRSRGVRMERPRAEATGGAGTSGGGTGAGVPGAGEQPRTPTGHVEQVPWPARAGAQGRQIGAEELEPSGGATGTGVWARGEAAGSPAPDAETPTPHTPAAVTGAGRGTATGSSAGYGAEAPAPHAPLPDSEAPTPHTPLVTSEAPTPSTPLSAGPLPSGPLPSGPGPETHARARNLLVPVADEEHPAPATPSVAPVLPGRPVADRPTVRAPGPETGAVGGPPCPWCGTPNRPDRHHCARCAMPLARGEEEDEARLPWWRRILDGRRNAVPWAGERPRLRRTFDRVLRWIVAAVVIGLVVFLGMKAPAGIQATRDHFAKRSLVSPDDFAASRSFPGHKPDLAFDGLSNTWWGPGVSGPAQGEWVEARFDEPTRLLNLIITPGVSTKSNRIRESALPHRVTATITMKDGKTKTRELVLDQGPGGQTRAFGVGEVTKVRFTVDSAYGATKKKQLAIAEIEFFGPSGDN
ncbi:MULTISPECIES: hypothetical protein [unclassified Streptomyces]|uniref:Zinc ribbon domain-containing protein n=1 Tax=Streptomyces evansiae TaxID=3075535 RepID=A0ABU2R480_9ACTN|nr:MULTISPECIES: hypothetical protein [unclassified Streptomyces]MDT0411138.1 hypothetical protein [Streptomyces sp. DSM 41979]